MPFCKNHNNLYFDNLRRVEKAETVLCLIHASYQAEIKNGTKADIVRMLKNAYELFRFDSGTYTGEDPSQFESQYTIGHELGIWVNSDLKLCSLAKKVAQNEITIKEYFDIFFLNYIQPIDGIINHPLYETLEYAKKHNLNEISKDNLKEIYNWTSNQENNINGLFNMFIGSNYFTKTSKNTIRINYPVDHILKCCNKECLNLSLAEANARFSNLEKYVEYLTADHRSLELIKDKFILNDFDSIQENSNINSNEKLGYNKIYYGIPGCGKSYHIENNVLKGVDKEKNVFRTTFYLDYSNSDFIGQIYPKVDDKGNVTYEPVPGPFTKALERAFSTDEMVYLVIEEINRGNAAAIFGDAFQLLDRLNEDRDDRVMGDSEYPISNEFIEGYLKKHIDYKKNQIYIPHNLTILATMNTSDQNVFPLDTAFKRRWSKEKITNDWGKVGHIKDMYVPFTDITWGKFAKTINEEMITNSVDKDAPISEDKQMGAYFVDKSMLTENPKEKDNAKLIAFTNNVVDYLYTDVTKFDHSTLFDNSIYSTDEFYKRVIDSINDPENQKAILVDIFTSNLQEKLTGDLKKFDGDIIKDEKE